MKAIIFGSKERLSFSTVPFWSFRNFPERIIAIFRAVELQHRFGPFLRPIARAPEHPIAAKSGIRNASKGSPE
jgi:hypothetical protein